MYPVPPLALAPNIISPFGFTWRPYPFVRLRDPDPVIEDRLQTILAARIPQITAATPPVSATKPPTTLHGLVSASAIVRNSKEELRAWAKAASDPTGRAEMLDDLIDELLERKLAEDVLCADVNEESDMLRRALFLRQVIRTRCSIGMRAEQSLDDLYAARVAQLRLAGRTRRTSVSTGFPLLIGAYPLDSHC